jgi:hypothetical protein
MEEDRYECAQKTLCNAKTSARSVLTVKFRSALTSAHEREQSSSTDHDDVVLRRCCQEVVAGDMHLT